MRETSEASRTHVLSRAMAHERCPHAWRLLGSAGRGTEVADGTEAADQLNFRWKMFLDYQALWSHRAQNMEQGAEGRTGETATCEGHSQTLAGLKVKEGA